MKKAFYFVAFSIFSLHSLSSQDDRRNWTWLLGYPSNLPNEEFGGARIDFSSGEPTVSFFRACSDFGFEASMSKFLHIIHAPDSLGQDRMVQQHGLELATFHAFMVPNFPYFRLYDLQGSPCDTLGPVSAGEAAKPWESLELFPVPAYDQINLRFSGNLQGAVCTIVDFTGKTVRTETCTGVSEVMTYNLAGLPAGMYVMVVYTADGSLLSKPFQILR